MKFKEGDVVEVLNCLYGQGVGIVGKPAQIISRDGPYFKIKMLDDMSIRAVLSSEIKFSTEPIIE